MNNVNAYMLLRWHIGLFNKERRKVCGPDIYVTDCCTMIFLQRENKLNATTLFSRFSLTHKALRDSVAVALF